MVVGLDELVVGLLEVAGSELGGDRGLDYGEGEGG